MKKRTYQSKEINQIDWKCVKKEIIGETVRFTIDGVKTKLFTLLGDKQNRCAI